VERQPVERDELGRQQVERRRLERQPLVRCGLERQPLVLCYLELTGASRECLVDLAQTAPVHQSLAGA
jgi:hypothetical protein